MEVDVSVPRVAAEELSIEIGRGQEVSEETTKNFHLYCYTWLKKNRNKNTRIKFPKL